MARLHLRHHCWTQHSPIARRSLSNVIELSLKSLSRGAVRCGSTDGSHVSRLNPEHSRATRYFNLPSVRIWAPLLEKHYDTRIGMMTSHEGDTVHDSTSVGRAAETPPGGNHKHRSDVMCQQRTLTRTPPSTSPSVTNMMYPPPPAPHNFQPHEHP